MQLSIARSFFLFTGIGITCLSCNNGTPKSDQNEKLPAAEQQLKQKVTQFPDSLLLRENLIQYYRDNSNYGEAIAETDKAIQKDTTNDRFWDIKATLSIENEDTLGAIKAFEKALELKADPKYIMSLGSLYAQTKNPMALALADGLLAAPKANAQKQALFLKGLYYTSTGEKQKALGFFDQCLTLDYTYLFAYREKAICLYDMGKYPEAISALEKAIAIQSTYEEGYYWMGRCYEKLGKRKEAIELYQQALQFDPEYIEAKEALTKLGAQ